ncbi:MAG: RagB/SusD family nutrient uptake outer membrane protein [Dysgonamonadaceae bacterium]|jgi:hypothetical protein|nr:RagB/SusD family nutrient uptake outer membrane protein [Dysgonamonadaceae bacterium]
MKKIINKLFILGLFPLFISCNSMLEETPRSVLTPGFFSTAQGLEAGLNSLYAGLRGTYSAGSSVGTDEFSLTDAVNATEACTNTYSNLLNSVNAGGGWSFVNINTCNGILEKGASVTDMDDARKKVIFAETKTLRALFYFRLVQTFGAVPLDLGSGKLAYNSNFNTLSERDPVPEVYEAIINDLEEALPDLPDQSNQKGRITKATALHFLSKVYLTRGWDDEAKQTNDFAEAFRYADELIQDRAIYGKELQQSYALVHAEGYEDDTETILNAQCTHDIEFGLPYGHSLAWIVTAGYENVRINGIAIVPRCMQYQRPWRMHIPTKWVLYEAFADKVNDSRWDGSFRMMWECRASRENGISTENIQALADYGMVYGDTAVLLILDEVIPPQYQDKKYLVYTAADNYYENAAKHTPYMYPTLYKYDDTRRYAINDVSMRPVFIARLAETYLLAAEALIMQGKKTEALYYINTVRKRAAYREGLSVTELADAETAMTVTDPSALDIDFILAERTRELCGEGGMRWYDLTRTHKLVERVRLYNPEGAPNIQDFHVLRPIPQSQIDLMSDEAQKASYQNQGYN